MFDKSKRQLDQVREVVSILGGGVYKRIDENRELLEELRRYAPDLLKARPWIELHLSQHDEFFVGVAEAIPPIKARFMPSEAGSLPFPCPWTTTGHQA